MPDQSLSQCVAHPAPAGNHSLQSTNVIRDPVLAGAESRSSSRTAMQTPTRKRARKENSEKRKLRRPEVRKCGNLQMSCTSLSAPRELLSTGFTNMGPGRSREGQCRAKFRLRLVLCTCPRPCNLSVGDVTEPASLLQIHGLLQIH